MSPKIALFLTISLAILFTVNCDEVQLPLADIIMQNAICMKESDDLSMCLSLNESNDGKEKSSKSH